MDHEAVFRELFDGHYDRIFFLFRRKGLKKDDALDLTQDTFARVYKSMNTYRGESGFGYLNQVAENVWKNHLRYWAAEARAAEEVPVEDHVLSLADEADVIRDLVDHERKERLEEAIQELPKRMGRCLQLWIEGLKYREIMAVMEISLDTVKSLIYQGKKRLQERLVETDLSSGLAPRKGEADD